MKSKVIALFLVLVIGGVLYFYVSSSSNPPSEQLDSDYEASEEMDVNPVGDHEQSTESESGGNGSAESADTDGAMPAPGNNPDLPDADYDDPSPETSDPQGNDSEEPPEDSDF